MSRVFETLAPLAARGMVLGLDSMREALAASGDPQRRIPCVHVAGTNGKGSVSAFLDGVLRASGYRVGLYTSPHLHRFVERIQIDGAPLDEDLAARHAEAIVGEMNSELLPSLTFFEAATLLAWRAFAEADVRVAVLEVGLGGRLDATTVCAPELTVITRIGLDHTDRLGSTLDVIAREKAGILKPGVRCVLGPDLTHARNAEARGAIEAAARELGAPLVDTPPYELDGDAVRVQWRGAWRVVRPSLRGAWQAGNLATAVRALELLDDAMLPITDDALRDGISSTRWPARMERLDDVLLDVAHNVDGVEALVHALPGVLGGRRVGPLVFGASRDKDVAAMLSALATVTPPSRWYFAAAPMLRAAPPDTLAAMRGGVACASPEEALAMAHADRRADEVVLVCGSIYFVAQVRAAMLGLTQEPPVGL